MKQEFQPMFIQVFSLRPWHCNSGQFKELLQGWLPVWAADCSIGIWCSMLSKSFPSLKMTGKETVSFLVSIKYSVFTVWFSSEPCKMRTGLGDILRVSNPEYFLLWECCWGAQLWCHSQACCETQCTVTWVFSLNSSCQHYPGPIPAKFTK